MRKILWIEILLLCSLPALAQFTVVTAMVADSNGTAYAGGTYNARLNTALGTTPTQTSGGSITLSGNPSVLYDPVNGISGSLDSTGSFTVSLIPNASILPANTSWVFTICSAASFTNTATGLASAGPTCFKSTQLISGTSQSLSASLSAAAPLWYFLNVPSVKATGAAFTTGGGTMAPSFPLSASVTTAVVIGDSITFPFGPQQGQSWAQLVATTGALALTNLSQDGSSIFGSGPLGLDQTSYAYQQTPVTTSLSMAMLGANDQYTSAPDITALEQAYMAFTALLAADRSIFSCQRKQ